MSSEYKTILTVNAGSSSLKLALFRFDTLEKLQVYTAANIGLPNGTLTVINGSGKSATEPLGVGNHTEAVQDIFDRYENDILHVPLAVIGHRIVHGGSNFNTTTRLTPTVLEQLKKDVVFDPEHIPEAIDLISVFLSAAPDIMQVACFDTTFYRDLPKIAQLFALPKKLQTLGVRRYGFHGLSYESILEDFREKAGNDAAKGRIVIAHLGSGASLTAIKDNKVVDTTMSFTPASGIPMSTRSGDLDPGIFMFLHKRAGMTAKEFDHMIHFESGLLGVSDLTADMEQLIAASSHNEDALNAVNLFCYQIKKAIGAFAGIMNGIDSLIFAGGIGENAPLIRQKICSDMDYLGLKIDSSRNKAKDFLISSGGSAVGVHVMHSDEAKTIAKYSKSFFGTSVKSIKVRTL